MTNKRQKPRPTKRLINNAKKLRKHATFPERLLWARLRRGQVHNFRFRRQHPIDGYIVDFVCNDVSLIIEIDSDSQFGNLQADLDRQAKLESMGCRVIRFGNDDILSDIDSVVDAIAHAVRKAFDARHPPPAPPLMGG